MASPISRRTPLWITLVVVAFGFYSGTIVILWGNRTAGAAVLGLAALQLWRAKPWVGWR